PVAVNNHSPARGAETTQSLPEQAAPSQPKALGVTEEWGYQTGSDVYSSPAVADLDGDGTLEVLVGSDDDTLYCLSHTGSEEWGYQTGDNVYSSPAVADLDGDGTHEVLVGSDDDTLYCLGLTGVTASGPGQWYCFRGSVFHTGQMDSDSDYLDDLTEDYYSTDPNDSDSDNDGYSDGEEIFAGTDPNDAQDYPGATTSPPETTTPPETTSPTEGTTTSETTPAGFPSWLWAVIGGGVAITTIIIIVLIFFQRKKRASDSIIARQQETTITPPKETIDRTAMFREVLQTYSSISLEKLARLLGFTDTFTLEQWLITKTEKGLFRIKGDQVIISSELQQDTEEAEAAIDQLLQSFEDFERKGKGKR
ncbi:MAG: PQQ-binding-like beta-propeller repeat protein, partial [Candidatus Heimdallarchaeota archaeon]|nr:PQQ-binding-like beta-propeller repeat protein [Candidatus Heimdallarchaeota archaeon]